MDAVARAEVEGDTLRVIPVGMAKLFTLRRRVSIPLSRIDAVELFTESDDDEPPPRRPGLYRYRGTKAMIVVGQRRPVVVIECPGAAFDRVVFSADNPEAVAHAVERALPTNLP